jgi:glyoxylase-like metal-dependent hydrolase (beta-lactamase superfamily II)
MKLFFHYCSFGFSNCYILGSDFEDAEAALRGNGSENAAGKAASREALIIDPGCMDEDILDFIENNDYNLRGALITHDHMNHVHGLKTLKRIYDVDIYAVNHVVRDHKAILVRDRDTINIGPFRVGVISAPGHSADSVVFKVDHMLFTGDTLSAGLVGRTASNYGAATQMTALRSKILSLPGDYTVLPGHGPPSSLEAERRFNMGILRYEERKNRRPSFTVDF